MYVDITARKSAEAALRRSEALLSHLFATSPDCLTLTDLETGRYALVNDCFLQVTGWRREEVIGRSSTELGIWQRPEDRDVFVVAIRRQGGVQAMPVNFRHREGRRIPLLASGARFDFDGQRFLVLAARDVSASEQTRLEVEAILNTVSLAIAFVREQRIVRVNARHREMFGYSEEELRQSTLSALWPDPAGFQRLRREAIGKLRQKHGYECEAQLQPARRHAVLGAPAGAVGRPEQPDRRRHHLDRRGHHRAPPDAACAGRCARRRRGGQPRQERLPRQHQPRDPHAAQRPARPARLAMQPGWPRRAASSTWRR